MGKAFTMFDCLVMFGPLSEPAVVFPPGELIFNFQVKSA